MSLRSTVAAPAWNRSTPVPVALVAARGTRLDLVHATETVFLMLSVGCSSGGRPMGRRTWLIAFSVLALIAAGVGVANWLSRNWRVGPGGQPSVAAGPAQHRVERWK